ncbi:MAG TPA: hypothetical protein VIS31_06380 [Woeseiaceae bacterium]
MSEKRPSCPKCRSELVVPVVFGFPTDAALGDAERGKIALGGCIVSENDPEWRCKSCGYEW